MVAGLLRRQRRLNRKADPDPLSVRLVSVKDLVFPPECPACGAPATTTTRLEESAEARRSNAVQLIIMILFAAALALWAYLGRWRA